MARRKTDGWMEAALTAKDRRGLAGNEPPAGCRYKGKGKKRKLVCDDAPADTRASRRHADLTRIVGEPKRRPGAGFDPEAFELFALGPDEVWTPDDGPAPWARARAENRAETVEEREARNAYLRAERRKDEADFDRRAGADEARVAATLKTWADNAEDDEGFRGLAAIPSASSLPITFGRAAPHAPERVDLSGGFVAFRGTKKRRRR